MKKNNIIILITLKKGIKRSWEVVRKMLKKDGRYKINFRKSSKNFIPLKITCGKCKTSLNICKVKNFPLKNKKCKCGNYFIKWEWSLK